MEFESLSFALREKRPDQGAARRGGRRRREPAARAPRGSS